jgi:hypothetical protein
MSRIVLIVCVSVLALSSLVIAVSIARPGGVPANAMRPDFDAVFADAASIDVSAFTDADRENLRRAGLAHMATRADR